MSKVWIITTDDQIANLVQLAEGKETTAVVIGQAVVSGVNQVLQIPIPTDTPAESVAAVAAQLVTAEPGDLVLARNGAVERAVAGAVAARLAIPVLVGLTTLEGNRATLACYGGISVEEVETSSAIVAVVEGGSAVDGGQEPSVQVNEPGEYYSCQVVSTSAEAGESVNLNAARKIVAVGRGFANQEDLVLAQDLARVLNAEMACSRPIAEGTGWMGRETYIGISGQHVSPDLYVAVGISGQIQHVAGMNNSKTVVAINQDDKAPIFEICDYGIVGDLYQVLPALVTEMK